MQPSIIKNDLERLWTAYKKEISQQTQNLGTPLQFSVFRTVQSGNSAPENSWSTIKWYKNSKYIYRTEWFYENFWNLTWKLHKSDAWSENPWKWNWTWSGITQTRWVDTNSGFPPQYCISVLRENVHTTGVMEQKTHIQILWKETPTSTSLQHHPQLCECSFTAQQKTKIRFIPVCNTPCSVHDSHILSLKQSPAPLWQALLCFRQVQLKGF